MLLRKIAEGSVFDGPAFVINRDDDSKSLNLFARKDALLAQKQYGIQKQYYFVGPTFDRL
jgi:hypothetical protein